MDLVGIGVDIEDITRFEDKINDQNFLNLIFTPKELKYCLNKKKPSQHLAVRFAGKEAVIKACSQKLGMKEIEILNDSNNAPFVNIKKEGFSDYKFKISLSHSNNSAISFVVVTK